MTGRYPDFAVIGAMKSGTSTLFYWLSEQPDFAMPSMKEPDFFSDDDVWRRGLDWYRTLFAPAGAGILTGESSQSYTSPDRAERAAQRMVETVPNLRLIYLLRHPVDRLRSHYRHQVRRGRESRPLVEAISDPATDYVGRSQYWTCLAPYAARFPRSQILVVRFEDLVAEGAPAWATVLDHVGAPFRPAPHTAHNVTATKPQFTKPMLTLWEAGLLDRVPRRMPKIVRRLGRRVLVRDGADFTQQLQRSTAPLPPDLVEPVWRDVARLEDWLGRDQPLWKRDDAPRAGIG